MAGCSEQPDDRSVRVAGFVQSLFRPQPRRLVVHLKRQLGKPASVHWHPPDVECTGERSEQLIGSRAGLRTSITSTHPTGRRNVA